MFDALALGQQDIGYVHLIVDTGRDMTSFLPHWVVR